MTTFSLVKNGPNGEVLVGKGQPLLLLAGPCVLESEEIAWQVAGEMQRICNDLGITYVFKASFDKANRTSLNSFRGPGLQKGLRLLSRIRDEIGVLVVSDVHEASQVKEAAEVLDIIQIPAFLCRQTDLLVAAAESGKVVNVKKGQFVSPWEMKYAVEKIRGSGDQPVRLPLREHTIASTHHPAVEVLVNEKLVDTLDFEIKLTLTLKGAVLEARHGRVESLQTGDCLAAGEIRFEGVTLLKRAAAPVRLPGTVRLVSQGAEEG